MNSLRLSGKTWHWPECDPQHCPSILDIIHIPIVCAFWDCVNNSDSNIDDDGDDDDDDDDDDNRKHIVDYIIIWFMIPHYTVSPTQLLVLLIINDQLNIINYLFCNSVLFEIWT